MCRATILEQRNSRRAQTPHVVAARKSGTKTSHFTSYKSGFKLPAKTFDTWESSAGIRKQEESGRIEVGEKSGEEHRICPECLSGGIHTAVRFTIKRYFANPTVIEKFECRATCDSSV